MKRSETKPRLFDSILFFVYILFMLACILARQANAQTLANCKQVARTTTKAIIVTEFHRFKARGPTIVIQCKQVQKRPSGLRFVD